MLGFFLGAPVWGTIGFILALFVVGITRKQEVRERRHDEEVADFVVYPRDE